MSLCDSQPKRQIGERMLAVQGMSDLTHAERTVLSCIAYHDGPGGSYPSIDQLCAECGGISRQRMFSLLKSIKGKGRLSWRRTRRGPNVYTVHYYLDVTENVTSRKTTLDVTETKTLEVTESVTGPGSKQEGHPMETIIGWCTECGFDRFRGQRACCACGSEAKPFIITPNEYQAGELTLPFGITVTGVDTMQGRRLFMSEEGQAALRETYRKVFDRAEH